MTKRAFCQACSNLIRGLKTRKSVGHTCSKEERDKIEILASTKRIIESGYAGVMPNGNIVDRREHPEVIEIQENPLFNTPKPKRVRRD